MNCGKPTKYTAVICAAGEGKRMGSFTSTCPKTLLKVGNKTIIEYILDNFSDCGLCDVVVVVGYKGGEIEKKIGNKYKNCNIVFICNKYYEVTDNLYSVYLTREKIKDGVIFFNADIIFNREILNKMIKDSHDNSLAVVSVDSPGAGKNPVRIKDNGEGRIVDIGHNLGDDHRQMVFGIYKLSPKTIKQFFILAGEYFKNGPCKGGFWLPLKKMVSLELFSAVSVNNDGWVSINTEEEYKNALSMIESIVGI